MVLDVEECHVVGVLTARDSLKRVDKQGFSYSHNKDDFKVIGRMDISFIRRPLLRNILIDFFQGTEGSRWAIDIIFGGNVPLSLGAI